MMRSSAYEVLHFVSPYLRLPRSLMVCVVSPHHEYLHVNDRVLLQYTEIGDRMICVRQMMFQNIDPKEKL